MPLDILDPSKETTLEHPSGARFVVRYWTNAMQEAVEKACAESDGKGGFSWNIARDRQMKIDLSLVGWSGVTMSGEELPFSEENKKKFPVGVQFWLFKEIEELAGLRMTDKEKKT